MSPDLLQTLPSLGSSRPRLSRGWRQHTWLWPWLRRVGKVWRDLWYRFPRRRLCQGSSLARPPLASLWNLSSSRLRVSAARPLRSPQRWRKRLERRWYGGTDHFIAAQGSPDEWAARGTSIGSAFESGPARHGYFAGSDWLGVFGGGTRPRATARGRLSTTSQCSASFPWSTRKKSAVEKRSLLPEGDRPRNGPSCVPVHSTRATSLSPSATISWISP